MTTPTGPAWYERVFHASPTAMLLLDTDLRVVDVNSAYLTATQHTADQLLGQVIFDPFPDNPDRPELDSVRAVRASMLRARDTGEVDQLVGRRYDIAAAGTDTFLTRYWNLTTVPVLDDAGQVALLLHRVQDVTAALATDAAEAAAAGANSELMERLATAQADLLARAQELQQLNERLRRAGRHDRSVAQALQAAMLPRLPVIDGVELAGRYLTAAIDDEVGGDWYDAVAGPDGATTVIIGDVVGHDIAAAAVMSRVRSMLQTFVWDRQKPPSTIVRLLDQAMRDLHLPTMATLAVLRVESSAPGPGDEPTADTGADIGVQARVEARVGAGELTLRWTVAGHPPPVLLEPDGATVLLAPEVVDPPLGVVPDGPRHDAVVSVRAGCTVVLYTDGLIETRDQDLDRGLQRLQSALSVHHRLPLQQLVDAVITDMVGEHPSDDIAVIAVRTAASRGQTGPDAAN